jgi:hypothetical protein
MSEGGEDRWAAIRSRVISSPELRYQYDRTRNSVEITRSILQEIDESRLKAGLSKAELARRAGISPSRIRRLFASDGSGLQLSTAVNLLAVVGLELKLGRQNQPNGRSLDSAVRSQ